MFLGRLQRFCCVFSCLKLISPTNLVPRVREREPGNEVDSRLIYMYWSGLSVSSSLRGRRSKGEGEGN